MADTRGMLSGGVPRRPRLGAAAWLVGPLAYLALEAVAAAGFPGYSYARNYISDLGVPSSSPRAQLMNVAFCLQGAMFLLGAVCISRARLFLLLVTTNAVGNVLVAVFHSGVLAHAVGAVLAIGGGNAAVLAGPARYRLLGLFGLLSFAVFLATRSGAWERGSVYAILAWQMPSAAVILWSRLD